MDDKPSPPHIFANRILKQIIQHSFGDDLVIEPKDYLALRVAYRSGGGLWDDIIGGDIKQIAFLGKIVAAWGKMPERKHSADNWI